MLAEAAQKEVGKSGGQIERMEDFRSYILAKC